MLRLVTDEPMSEDEFVDVLASLVEKGFIEIDETAQEDHRFRPTAAGLAELAAGEEEQQP